MPRKDTTIKNIIIEKMQQDAALEAQQKFEHDAGIREKLRAAKIEARKPKIDEAWKKLRESAARLQEPQMGYDTGTAAWMAIVAHLQLLVAADPAGTLVRKLLSAGETGIYKCTGFHVSKNLSNVLDRLLHNTTVPPVDISGIKLQHFAEYNKAGTSGGTDTLNSGSLTKNLLSSDNKDFSQEELALFEGVLHQAMVEWLNTQHYIPAPGTPQNALATTFVLDSDPNQTLTKERFEQLRDDKSIGLDSFFSERFDLTFESASGPRP